MADAPAADVRYVEDPYRARRRATREVRVGDVGVGGASPIRIQSMTNTDTLDVAATVDQIQALAEAGCEIVRVAAPSIRDAEALATIREHLAARRVRIPLVADIHFTPKAALIAAEHVEKVRVNPGNYADKKKFEVREYTDAAYAEELERVAGRFRPLVRRCKELGRAMRIGTNHGSLSDRIMNRFGDTPLGMVESALEFLDVCEDEGYRDVVFSMKASNTQVAIQAYRLLARRLEERAPGVPGYPFHVGVTEAGDGLDGRVKSAIGIGGLLEDGIGDTIRVSLTEDPVAEVPVARALARRYEGRAAPEGPPLALPPFVADPYAHARRPARVEHAGALRFGGDEEVRVELEVGPLPEDVAPFAARLATSLALVEGVACEGLVVGDGEGCPPERFAAFAAELESLGSGLPIAVQWNAGCEAKLPAGAARAVLAVEPGSSDGALDRGLRRAAGQGLPVELALHAGPAAVPSLLARALHTAEAHGIRPVLLSVRSAERPVHAVRALCAAAGGLAPDTPLRLRHRPDDGTDPEDDVLAAAIDLGVPLCDGMGDAVALAGFDDAGSAVDLAYRVLQGARLRTTRTEYISCPSCGRTLFDLEETTARIKEATAHLVGVKIAVMGCIVNGPGEMADADFGYVGSGVGQVNLYVGKQVVARAVPEAEAPQRLVELIDEQGRWHEPARRG